MTSATEGADAEEGGKEMQGLCVFMVLVSMVAAPVSLIVWLVKKLRKKPTKKVKRIFWASVACFVVFSVAGAMTAEQCEHEYELAETVEATCVENGSELYRCGLCDGEKKVSVKKLGHEMVDGICSRCGYEEEGADEPKVEVEADVTVDGEPVYGLYEVLEAVGIDKVDAKYIKKTDDWRLGPCYSFSTNGTTARVNCSMDGTVYALVVGTDLALYQQGYEPWNIADFIVSEDAKMAAMARSEELVKSQLNYPATAKFPLLDWTVTRNFNWYTVKSHVTAKNGFGVEDEISFMTIFWVEENSIKPIYFSMGGKVIRDDRAEYPLPERETVDFEVEQPTDGGIRIYDGQLGEYGKKVQLDSYEYDWYMVPAGKYEAVSNVKTCTVYVDKNEVTRNSDGYVEMENVATYTWSYGETVVIDVGEDEHLFNVVGADYTLTRIDE